MIQKLEDPKIAGNLSDPKTSGDFEKSRKMAKKFANPENRIWPNFKPKK